MRKLLIAAAAVAALLPAVFATNGYASTGGISSADQLEPVVLRDINVVRRAHGLRPLRLCRELSAAADQHSQEMARAGYFEHESRDGSAFVVRLDRYYPQGNHSTWSVGENLVYATPDLTGKQAVTTWMHSAGHRANILNPAWHEIGIGAVHAVAAPGIFGGLEVTVMTADFGVRD